MNTDYKILARIMARWLNPIMQEQIITCQYSVVSGKNHHGGSRDDTRCNCTRREKD
jgi:hypothetical protein